MKKTFKRSLNKTIFNTALLALVLSMSAIDSVGHCQYIVALASSGIVMLYAYANGWMI